MTIESTYQKVLFLEASWWNTLDWVQRASWMRPHDPYATPWWGWECELRKCRVFQKRVHRECQHSEGCVFKWINSVLFWEFHGGYLLYTFPNIPSFSEIDLNFIYLLLRQKKKTSSVYFSEIHQNKWSFNTCVSTFYLCLLNMYMVEYRKGCHHRASKNVSVPSPCWGEMYRPARRSKQFVRWLWYNRNPARLCWSS